MIRRTECITIERKATKDHSIEIKNEVCTVKMLEKENMKGTKNEAHKADDKMI
jgi:hypothetical protein